MSKQQLLSIRIKQDGQMRLKKETREKIIKASDERDNALIDNALLMVLID